jgi:enterochelin esterase-like enzyme
MTKLACAIALSLIAAGDFAAAHAAEQSAPAESNVLGAPTPSIHADRSITFTLKAPDAHTVQVAGGDGLGSERFRAGIGGAAEALKQAGVKVIYFESTGTAHEWQTWRRGLNDFLPRLFR